jgi:hypothetical protein
MISIVLYERCSGALTCHSSLLLVSLCRVPKVFKSHRHMVNNKLLLSALFLLALFQGIALAQDITVSGTVIDQTTGEAIPTAKVRIYSNTGHLTKGPEPVSLNGEFRIILSSYQGGTVKCEISETNYVKRRITLPIDGARRRWHH